MVGVEEGGREGESGGRERVEGEGGWWEWRREGGREGGREWREEERGEEERGEEERGKDMEENG